MKKRAKSKKDVDGMMVQIQEQLALMNQKLDSFMTKSLTELAQALANSRPVAKQPPAQTAARPASYNYQARRPMYAVVCYECGKDTELPFKPSGNRPVYCKECFALRKVRASSGPGHTRVPPAFVQNAKPEASASTPAVKAKRKAAPGKPAKSKRRASGKPAAKKKSPAKKKSALKKSGARKKPAGKAKAKKKNKGKKR